MKKKFSLNSLSKITPLCIFIALLMLVGFSAAKVHFYTSASSSVQLLTSHAEVLQPESFQLKKTENQGNIPVEEIAHPIEFGSEEEDDDREDDDYHSFDAYKGEQAHSISHYDGALDITASNSIHFSFQIPLYILFHSWRVFIA